ncbi:TEA/ATTS domain family-domain-containing protein [Russula earlei]|uniref:TEA/ATTS domain family-domain-containing protein n=1 Tax=Russula earlei TaxID=71964 RepID=A0ACC0UH73_9AGAM|nr:TEA/ATTS domain family-domain-containing protein [Russula earlei]
MPRSLPAATPPKARAKSKGNRSIRCIPGGNEAIWDDELHTALIEALSIYPPMGRQRIRPMHNGDEGRTSLGRCQLIQQYLMQRTGKNRTRKQISSRIQRLRRMHQDDPAMADVLRVLPDVYRPIAPEMLVNLNDSSEVANIIPALIPATPPLLGSVESSASSSPSTIPLGESYHSSASSSSIRSNQLTLRLFEPAELHASYSENAGIGVSVPNSGQENMWPAPGSRLPDRSVSSLSRRRMTSDTSGLRFQLDLPPGPQFPYSSYDLDATTMSDGTGLLSFAGNQFPYLHCHGHPANPITPVDQIIHTPEFPPEVFRCDKRSTSQSPYAQRDDVFPQPMTCPPSLSPCDSHPCSHLFAAAEHSSSKSSPFQTSRAQNYSFPSSPFSTFHPSIYGASSCLVALGPEDCQDVTQTQDVTHLVHLPRRLSYPCNSHLLDSGLSLRMPSAVYSCVSEEGDIASTLGNLELASPAVIRPFFPADFQCPAPGGSPHIPLNELLSASVDDGAISQ